MYFAALIIMLLLIAFDQLTKVLTIKYIMPIDSVSIINGFFNLTYVENRGAAFGFLQGAKWLFVVIALVLLIAGAVYYHKLVKGNKSRAMRLALILVGAGAIGNVIDRVFRGFVVDMLDFYIFGYNYPVFNFADICVCLGAAIMILMILFKKEDV